MTTLKNDSKTCEISKNTTKDGTSWELAIFKTGTRKADRWKKTSFHIFATPIELIEFITFHKFA